MIINKKKLYERINNYRFFKLNKEPLENRINNLADAINKSVYKIGNSILKKEKRIDLAYSGGIDSTIILVTLLNSGFPIIAHTITNKENHPDMIYSNEFISSLNGNGENILHKKYLIKESKEKIEKANEILRAAFGIKREEISENYYELFNAVKSSTSNLVCCDCIDELLGGYYANKDPTNLSFYDKTKNIEENRKISLYYFMNRLIPDHLRIIDEFSKYFGINIWLPYGDEMVIKATENFDVNELVDNKNRKKPIIHIAKSKGIPDSIITRRKYGLVSALDKDRKN